MSNNSTALFACSKCFTKHPFEELSSGQQLCKIKSSSRIILNESRMEETTSIQTGFSDGIGSLPQPPKEDCRGAFPFVKCTYCRSEFQQTNKVSTSTICTKCENNVKQFGKPSACEYCNIIAAFIGNKCQRCTNSERKYGPPVTCEQCKQKCAFDRKDDDKKVDGKLLCWLCTLSYKRALAKTKQSDAERRAHMKLAAQRSSKTRDNRLRGHNKRPNRVDVTKVDVTRHESNDSGLAVPPANKLARTGNHRPPGDVLDPNSSDHVVAMTQLKEQMASLQKQLSQKDAQLLAKDKMITELKAKHFTSETELRNKMLNNEKEHEKKVDQLSLKIKSLQKEVAMLSKSNKKGASSGIASSAGGGGGSGSGTDSPLA